MRPGVHRITNLREPKPPAPRWLRNMCGVLMSIGLAMLVGLGIWYGIIRPVFG